MTLSAGSTLLRRSLVLALASSMLATAALADDVGDGPESCGESVTQEILGILLAAGNIDRDQYEALCRNASREEQAPVVAATPPVGEEGPSWDFKWSNGFKLKRSDGAFKLGFGGRIMVDGAFIWQDDALDRDFAALRQNPKDGSGFEFRRARLFFDGTVYDRVVFKMQYDFAQPEDDDNPDFKDVWLGLKDLGPVGQVRAGHFKEPMLLEEWTSSKYMTFMERGLNSVFFPGRNMGVMAMGNAAKKKFFWQLGGFRSTNDQGFAFDEWEEGAWDIAGRVVGVPLYSEEGDKVVHLGASYIHRFRGNDGSIRYRERPESHLAQRYVDTRLFDASGADILNLELAGVWKAFSAQAEFTNSWVSGRADQKDTWFWGLYGYASWFITGEHRKYEVGKGRFGRVKPKANFNPVRGDWGAWELAARYSYLDLNDRNINGGKLWTVTAGLNWHLFPNLRMMWNYIHADVGKRATFVTEDDVTFPVDVAGAGDIFQMRLQIDF